MPIVLFRVDERLIHGQVVVGWGERLHAERIVVVDDGLSDSAWEQELYRLGVPDAVDAVFMDVAEARAALPTLREEPRRAIVLVRDLGTLERLAAAGALDGQAVNLGGIHHAAGREPVLPYLYLSPRERELLRAIGELGVDVSARDLPGSRAVPLEDLVGRG